MLRRLDFVAVFFLIVALFHWHPVVIAKHHQVHHEHHTPWPSPAQSSRTHHQYPAKSPALPPKSATPPLPSSAPSQASMETAPTPCADAEESVPAPASYAPWAISEPPENDEGNDKGLGSKVGVRVSLCALSVFLGLAM
ncbi:hypothetical protein PIB30_028043 [Stylosanthes scabra]|uniref:Uncharacterized protein n=1 Tax=Stylosanthes scabra TaxID=79078 RepID=A0ABU6Z8J3_9FABA|nr:hypothetical protein [Stylosanthes scabra]